MTNDPSVQMLPEPCQRCGDGPIGQPIWSVAAQGADVFVYTEKPVAHMVGDRMQMEQRLQSAGIDPARVVWSAAVKCGKCTRSFKAGQRQCKLFFPMEVNHYRPTVILTFGKRALESAFGIGSHHDHVGLVRRVRVNSGPSFHECWHLHLHDTDELREHPELNDLDQWARGKILQILNGEYPKDFRAGKHYFLIQTREELRQWLAYYGTPEYIALDIETGGYDHAYEISVSDDPWHPDSYIIGTSLCGHEGFACFVDFRGEAGLHQDIYDWITSNNKKLIVHNGKFDLLYWWVKFGLNLYQWLWRDTMIADGLLREWQKTHGLKWCASRWLPEFEDYDAELRNFFADTPSSQIDYGNVPSTTLVSYACADVDVTLRLFYLFEQQLIDAGMVSLKQKMIDVLDAYGEMEFFGWGHDRQYWEQLRVETEAERDRHLRVLQQSRWWQQYRGYREAEERAQDKAFWEPTTQRCWTSSECLEFADARFMYQTGRRAGTRKVSRTYTMEDIEPDPTNDQFKRTILFDPNFLNLRPIRFTEKKQEPKVDRAHLQELKRGRLSADAEIVIDALLELQTLSKRLNSFVYPVYPHVNDKGEQKLGWLHADGLIHPNYLFSGQDWGDDFQEGGTVSGRASCINPNMQQQPTRRGGKKFKKQFRPAPRDYNGRLYRWEDGSLRYTDPTGERWVYIQLDYSQLELRVLAALSGEAFMCRAYQNNEDLHTGLACQLFNRTLEWFKERLDNEDHPEHELAFNERLIAKTSWFAVLYGSGAGKLCDILALMDVEMSKREAQAIIDQLYAKLPSVAMLKNMVQGYAPVCLNPFGRRRVCNNIYSTDQVINAKAHRQLFNFLIQSTGSDIASSGIIRVVRWLKGQRRAGALRAYPVGAVHDSFIIAVPESEVDYVAYNAQQRMQDTSEYTRWLNGVPIKVDVEFGPSYGDMRKWTWPAREAQAA